MIKKIKRFFYNFLYSIPFGMKSANDEMFSQKNSSINDIGINESIQKDSLGRDLIKGEVTQQVEELRYRTYKVSRESENYSYLGNGVAVKNDSNEESDIIEFSQENREICADILTELNRVDKDYGKEEYTLSIIYNDIPRFKLEKYCKEFSVVCNKINDNISKAKIRLFFSIYSDSYDNTSRQFINELKSLLNGKLGEFQTLNMITFITYRSNGEDDLIKYELYNLNITDLKEVDGYYMIEYSTDFYQRFDLSSKFYSDSMDKKYKNKEKKKLDLDLSNSERVRFCSMCGKRISVYDGDITQETYGYPLCSECIEKTLDKVK